jgi:hypothetical protein
MNKPPPGGFLLPTAVDRKTVTKTTTLPGRFFRQKVHTLFIFVDTKLHMMCNTPNAAKHRSKLFSQQALTRRPSREEQSARYKAAKAAQVDSCQPATHGRLRQRPEDAMHRNRLGCPADDTGVVASAICVHRVAIPTESSAHLPWR